jgi:hypothetical protein
MPSTSDASMSPRLATTRPCVSVTNASSAPASTKHLSSISFQTVGPKGVASCSSGTGPAAENLMYGDALRPAGAARAAPQRRWDARRARSRSSEELALRSFVMTGLTR